MEVNPEYDMGVPPETVPKHIQDHHYMVKAQQSLLSTLGKERALFGKSLNGTFDATLSPKAQKKAQFGTIDSQVRGLERDGNDNPEDTDLLLVAEMKEDRQLRHEEAVHKFKRSRSEVDEQMKLAVTKESGRFKDFLRQNNKEIVSEFEQLADDKLVVLEEVGVQRVWEEVAAQAPRREEQIDGLARAMEAIEQQRQALMKDALAKLSAALVDTAHVSTGEIERYLEQESMRVNELMIENRKVRADLVRRLLRAEVRDQRERRQSWEKSMERWRTMRTLGAVRIFQQLLESEDFAAPPARTQMMGAVLDKQEETHNKIMEHFMSLEMLLPPDKKLQSQSITDWLEIINGMGTTWEGTWTREMARLWEHEDELQQRALDAFHALEADVKRYNGYSEEDAKTLLEEEAFTYVKDRQHQARGTLKQLEAYLKAQSGKWKEDWSTFGGFMTRVAKLHDDNRAKVLELHQASVDEVKGSRDLHEKEDAQREEAFQDACKKLQETGKHELLEEHVKAANDCLEHISDGYRTFNKRTIDIVEQNPVMMHSNGQAYEVALCGEMSLVPTVELAEEEGQEGPPEEEESQEGEPEDLSELTVLSDGGLEYPAKKDHYKVLYEPPEEEEEESSEEGESADEEAKEEAKEGEEGEGAEEEEEDFSDVPELPLADLPVGEELLRHMIMMVQTKLVSEMEKFQEGIMEKAQEWATAGTEELTEELDSMLRSHRPRAGRVEEDLMRAREVDLIEQDRKYQAFIRAVTRALQEQQQVGRAAHQAASEAMDAAIARITHAEAMLSSTPSTKALEIRRRAGEKTFADVNDLVAKRADQLRAALLQDQDQAAAFKDKFAEEFRDFESGGNFAPEVLEEYRSGLEGKIEQASLARTDMQEDVDTLQAEKTEAAQAAYESFTAMLDPHRDDLTLLEALEGSVSAAKTKLRHAFEDSSAVADQIKQASADLATVLVQWGAADADGAVPLELLKRVDKLRRLLLPRCTYLGCLQAAMELKGGLALSIEPPAEGEEAAAAEAAGEEAAAGAGAGQALTTLTEELVGVCREELREHSSAYYSAKAADREITRPDRIPASLEEMMEAWEKVFKGMTDQAENHVDSGRKEVRAQVIVIADQMVRVPSVALTHLLGVATKACQVAVDAVDSQYGAAHASHMAAQEANKVGLKPGLGAAGLEDMLAALLSAEVERAHASVDSSSAHAGAAMDLLGGHAGRFAARLQHVAGLLLALMDNCVLPKDLVPQEVDDELKSMKRKNLRQLRRMLRAGQKGDDEDPNEAHEGREYTSRTWPALNLPAMDLKEAGWDEEEMKVITAPPAAGEGEGEEAAAAAPAEGEGEEGPAGTPVVALDTPCQQSTVNARDRVFNEFQAFYYKQVKEHKELVFAQLKDEMQWKAIWDSLVETVKAGGVQV